MGSDIDDLFNVIKKWDVSTIESIWYHEHEIGSYVAMTHDQGDYKKKKTQYDKILKSMESNSNFVDEAKLIILKYFLFDENKKRDSIGEQSEKVISQVNELLMPDDVSNSSDESKGREISKMQLFAALDMRDNGYEIVKVTWKNVTSAWGPKVIFKDAECYYHLFEKQADFGALVDRYRIAAGLGSAQYIAEYYLEEILGGRFVRMKTQETSNCKTLDLRFREAEEEERKTLFTGVMRAYFRDDATIKEITEEEKFGHTFPRLEDGDLETIRSSMGTRILLSTVEVKRKQHHIVHGDEWGGNFLVKKNNDVYFIDFEDALYCQKETDKIETVGGDLSSRIFYKTKESKDVEKRFSLYGLGICGSLGRLLAALIQYECRPNGNLKGRFRDDEIKPTITCFLDSFNEAPGDDGLERGDLLMYRNQILAYAWDWGIYWNEKNMWRSGTFDIFEKIIKELLEEKDGASILTPPRSAGTARDGGVTQNQSGNNNIQINSGRDAITAIGEGASAAGLDYSVSIQVEPIRMSSELDSIFDGISRWSIENIRSIMFHEEWTRQEKKPFPVTDKSKVQPALAPEDFTNCRDSLMALLEQDSKYFDDEQNAKLIICSTFLLMNDKEDFRHGALESLLNKGEVKANLLRLFTNEMDADADKKSIKRLQLFYALYKQRENPSLINIQKVTWGNVTSKWGPKIVMTDGESYQYIFNDFEEFEECHKRYNIAAKLGETGQYRSEYLNDGGEFNLRIIKVLATKGCRTLDEYFKANYMSVGKNETGSKLFERLSEEYFRNDLDTTMVVSSEVLRRILPRLTLEKNKGSCVDSILSRKHKWKIPRTKITDENDSQSYYVVHGDEWGGNFLVTDNASLVYVIDYEDAIYSNVNDKDNVLSVGGDLSSRIFSPGKNEDKEFLPIGLSVFASIGRLLAAVVQYHSRWDELEINDIGNIVNSYLNNFQKSLEVKDPIFKNNYWEGDLQPLILLHAWDWALYWKQKKTDTFPPKHYEKFIEEIKKLLPGAAIGEGAIAAAGDIIISTGMSEEISEEILEQLKQITFKLSTLKSKDNLFDENQHIPQEEIVAAGKVVKLASDIEREGFLFKPKTELELGEASLLAGKLEIAEGYFNQALRNFMMPKFGDKEGEVEARIRLGTIAIMRGKTTDAEEYYNQSLDLSKQICYRKGEAKSLGNLGNIKKKRGEYDDAKKLYRECLMIAREVGYSLIEANSLDHLGTLERARGEMDEAEKLHQESLHCFRLIKNRQGEATALNSLGWIAKHRGALNKAKEIFKEASSINREIGRPAGIASDLYNLGIIEKILGNLEHSKSLIEESIMIRRKVGIEGDLDRPIMVLGVIAKMRGEFGEAEILFQESLAIAQKSEDRISEIHSLNNLGTVAMVGSKKYKKAEELFNQTLELSRELGERGLEAISLNNLGLISKVEKRFEDAKKYYADSLEIDRSIDNPIGMASSMHDLGVITNLQGDIAGSEVLINDSLKIARSIGHREGEAYSLYYLGVIAETRSDYVESERLFELSLSIQKEIGITIIKEET